MSAITLISSSSLTLNTPDGRQVVKDLNMHLAFEQVAIIGRNGVGKSTLVKALAAQETASNITRTENFYCVYQSMSENLFNANSINVYLCFAEFEQKQVFKEFSKIGLAYELDKTGFSQGELRKLNLIFAKLKNADLLLLDEPTIDLDEKGKKWLLDWLSSWQKGLIVVTHDQQLQRQFEHFFILSEAGCQYFSGNQADLITMQTQEQENQQIKYLNNLNHLIEQEKRSDQINKRRQQKKNQERLRELGRMTPKMRLNAKRSFAQESQGRVATIQNERMQSLSDTVKTARKQLKVSLPLKLFMPSFLADSVEPLIELRHVTLAPFFHDLTLSLTRKRLAITGLNGAGKSSLIEVILERRKPDSGQVLSRVNNIGYIAQDAANWQIDCSLLEYLFRQSATRSQTDIMQIIVAHKFPMGLAERPMGSLSPGERLRAALICLFTVGNSSAAPIECLVLDEPTVSLDSLAFFTLKETLNSWQGGLVVASHDSEFLRDIGISDTIQLNNVNSG
jgi:ATPase subunit of ABC transporter with duplicated ATPase domains